MANEISTMTKSELSIREKVIERGKRAFVEVGNALAEIRDRRGYKTAGFDTFENYCREKWDWNPRNVSYYIGAAQVGEKFGSQLPNLGLAQAAELARLSTPKTNDKRVNQIDIPAVQEVAAKIDFSTATVKDVARAVDAKLAERRNSTVTYHNQPAIHATRGAVPLAGTSHVYTVNKLLWPEDVENLLSTLLFG